MRRQIITLLFISLSSAALLASSCTANVTEGCLGGICSPNGLGGAGAGSTTSGGMDGGDEGGLNTCVGMDPPATGDFPCAVFDVIHRECNPCHTTPPMNGAPFPLLTFEDTQAPYGVTTMKIYQVMNGQIRPGGIPRMPLGGKLNDADLKTLGDWLNSCAPPVAEGMGCECSGHGLHALSVEKSELGRVLDPEALASAGGARARVQIEVPADWLAEACELDVLMPRRLVCARCDGGGCDGCGRSGALRAPAEDAARSVLIRLGPASSGVAIRIVEPFGAEAAIAQMILEVQEGARPSPGVTRRAAPRAPTPARRAPAWPGVALLVLSATAAILLATLAR